MRQRVRLGYAGVAVLVLVAAAPAGRRALGVDDACTAGAAPGGFVSCVVVGGEEPDPGTAASGALSSAALGVPWPVTRFTDGEPGCVTGPGRPVVATATPVLSVTFTATPADVVANYQTLDGSTDMYTGGLEPPDVLDFQEGDLAPGESYRWRVRALRADETPDLTETRGWSEWCEFTVAADAPDFRGVDPGDVDTVRELGVRPDRQYPVTLTARQWRAVLAVLAWEPEAAAVDEDWSGAEAAEMRLRPIETAVREQVRDRAPGDRVPVVLTGDRWATVANELAGWAGVADQVAAEEPDAGADGSAYWALVDGLSAELGGPPHPGLGYER